MKHFPCTAVFSNFNCYSSAKAKELIGFPSSLQVFAFAPDITVVRTNRFKWEKSLLLMDFLFFSKASGYFLLNFTITLLLES